MALAAVAPSPEKIQPSPALDSLWARGRDFLGSRLAILGGAMTWVSERNLVAAISDGGGFGVLASGSMPPEILRTEIQATKTLTDQPFGVNLIVMHPQLEQLAQVCIDEKVGIVVLAGGTPPAATIKLLKDGGARVIGFAPTVAMAKKLIRNGIDALVIEGMEAGGHIGAVSTAVLAQEILPVIQEVPVFIAGGIGRGEAIASFLEMGAAGVQLGTRFVCASESVAHEKFKTAFIRANARDAQPSVQLDSRFPVIPVRALVNQASKDFMARQREVIAKFDAGDLDLKSAQLEIEHFWAGALRKAVVDGDIEAGSLMAGQSVGLVSREEPCTAILSELVTQANAALASRRGG
jgi:enoyl-[acyl-carrier protein] reductase II